MDWKKKYQIIRFLQRAYSLKEADNLTPNQVAHRATTLIERILESKEPHPAMTLEKELQTTFREPD
jgi:hypothetical protein